MKMDRLSLGNGDDVESDYWLDLLLHKVKIGVFVR